eukprot:TRINITY_DN6364_c0_g3_i1.p1 TRINITY_DN6364_c0_g3~~TRINITY_DN6364_c0_g3_i1.p1  ORF type:complete len:1313 (-),score=127.43 TRINITY_DN6364_c0_g3_i1:116-4054(-)
MQVLSSPRGVPSKQAGVGAHVELNSDDFFSYLKPADAALRDAFDDRSSIPSASSSSRPNVVSPRREEVSFSNRSVGKVSGLLSRVLAKRSGNADESLGIDAGFASPMRHTSHQIASPRSGGRDRTSQSTPSALGKRQRHSESNDASLTIASPAGDAQVIESFFISESPFSRPLEHAVIIHDFRMPLAVPSTNPKRTKKGGRGKPSDELALSQAAQRLPSASRNASLADVLSILSPSNSARLGEAAWSTEVLCLETMQTLKGIPAIRRALRQLELDALLPHILTASWPENRDAWHPLRIDANRAPLEEPCEVAFRSVSNEELSLTAPREAIQVRLRLCPVAAASWLGVSERARATDSRCEQRVVEWMAESWTKRSRKKKRALDSDESQSARIRLLGNQDDVPAMQPPHFFRFPLRRQQLRSLRWMQQCEEDPRTFDLIFNEVHADPSGFYRGPMQLAHRPPSFSETLPWRYLLRCREVYKIRGGILADAMGYGKTATTIGLIDSRRGVQPRIPEDESLSFFSSCATLILVPSNLLEQWLGEFTKFLSRTGCEGTSSSPSLPLRIFAIRTVAQLKSVSVRQLCNDFDVVICSYRLLFSPVYRRRLLELSGTFSGLSSESAVAHAEVDVETLRSNTRRFIANPVQMGWKHRAETSMPHGTRHRLDEVVEDVASLRFPVLEQIWWTRIVFDEFHELEAMGNTVQFESLRNLCGSFRWGLTGTPPTRDVEQIATLAQLFQIGTIPVDDDSDDVLADRMARSFVDHFVRQNTDGEVLPVQLREHIVDVHHTPEERLIYLQALHGATSSTEGDAHNAAAREANLTFEKTQELLKLCSHFAYGGSTCSDAGSECKRLLTQKQKLLRQCSNRLKDAAAIAELVLRVAVPHAGLRCHGNVCVAECSTQNDNVEMSCDVISSGEGATSPALDMMQTLWSKFCPAEACSLQDRMNLGEQEIGGLSSEASVKELDETRQATPPNAVAEALKWARQLSLAELKREVEVRSKQVGEKRSALLEAVRKASSHAALESSDVSSSIAPLVAEARKEFDAAVAHFDVALRSSSFFEKALAATQGDGSAEHRTCNICLDEDIPLEELSITVCAHVFHTSCLREVVANFNSCPTCRRRLDSAKDVTPLVSELAVLPKPCALASSGNEAVARQAGSKLTAIALRLREIERQGEKAIVFCQWEELKRKVAGTLGAFGIRHLQLAGSAHQRGETLRRFQEERGDGCPTVLLLSLEHSASGTNLTVANHVIFVHPMCAESGEVAVAQEAQALARCRRWGQEKPEVHCWRFVTRGTVEESITAQHQTDLWSTHVQSSG